MATKKFHSPKRAWGGWFFFKNIQSPFNIPPPSNGNWKGWGMCYHFGEKKSSPILHLKWSKNFNRHPMVWVCWMAIKKIQSPKKSWEWRAWNGNKNKGKILVRLSIVRKKGQDGKKGKIGGKEQKMGLVIKEEFKKQEGMKEERIKNMGVWKFCPYHHMATKTILVTIKFSHRQWMETKKGGFWQTPFCLFQSSTRMGNF